MAANPALRRRSWRQVQPHQSRLRDDGEMNDMVERLEELTLDELADATDDASTMSPESWVPYWQKTYLFELRFAKPPILDYTELYETELKARKSTDKLKLLTNPEIRTRFLGRREEWQLLSMYAEWCNELETILCKTEMIHVHHGFMPFGANLNRTWRKCRRVWNLS